MGLAAAVPEVVVTGGTVRHEDLGVVGEAALAFIRQFRVDIGLIGISSLDGDGTLRDYSGFTKTAHASDVPVVVDTDILSLTLFPAVASWGADIAVGSTQRFGVPMGFGGPHAAFLSCREDETRKMPGRIIGVSKDAAGKVQESTGKVIGSHEQQLKGITKQVEGQAQKAVGDLKEVVKDATRK